MDNSRYLKVFIEEANEYLQTLNHYLLDLERLKEDFKEADKLFRAVHSLKGMASIIGYDEIVRLTHKLENVFNALRNQELKINSELVDDLLEVVDLLEQIIKQINRKNGKMHTGFNSRINKVISKLDNITDLSTNEKLFNSIQTGERSLQLTLDSTISLNMKEELDQGKNCLLIKVILNSDIQLISARAFTIINRLKDYGDIIKITPKLEIIEQGKLQTPNFTLILSTIEAKQKLKSKITAEVEVIKVIINEISLNQLNIDSYESKANDYSKDVDFNWDPTVKVGIDQLDDLMNLVGELMINKSQVVNLDRENKFRKRKEVWEDIDKSINLLHGDIMELRMISLTKIIDRFPRMVRDLSKKMDKQVKLEVKGEDIEIDRVIIEELGDPLVHLLRNCIDHGIEKPQERIANKKQKVGTVKITASQHGNEVKIVVSDDGSGIDDKVIKRKAIEKGIINSAEAEEMMKDEIIDLIFVSGFSTSEEVTSISGRGVGMDVVNSKIVSLGGQIRVDSIKGEGTKFIIELPITSSIIQALIVRVDVEKYVLPLNHIDEVHNVAVKDIKERQGKSSFVLREEKIELTYLHHRLALTKPIYNPDDEVPIIIISIGEKKEGLVVDELISQQKIVVKPLNGLLSNISSISGATILGNGQIALILNMLNIA
ncbi:chemotaxis protein CheA [Selenihalanaerobacter shriftii]|uniref:chemotaxis protein CheA n=1 Tax=Selenihalanaerobacter shriftii TaxID=142842 RepID=UPI0013565A2D|nr:chemotaxis protein CheA [Selenihalanaerobacter shriftii]